MSLECVCCHPIPFHTTDFCVVAHTSFILFGCKFIHSYATSQSLLLPIQFHSLQVLVDVYVEHHATFAPTDYARTISRRYRFHRSMFRFVFFILFTLVSAMGVGVVFILETLQRTPQGFCGTAFDGNTSFSIIVVRT